MAFPKTGESFPDFELGEFASHRAQEKTPLFLVVWQTECSTSRLTMPFVQRLHQSYPGATIVSVMQNQPHEAQQYSAAHKLTMLTLADIDLKVSRLLDVHTVPSYWLISEAGIVEESGIGWDRAKFESIAKTLAAKTGAIYTPLVTDSDKVANYVPG